MVAPSSIEGPSVEFWRSLRRLWRHQRFRKIMAVRVTTQAADGTLQVGMASYVLFSPEQQPNALAIAAVLAITLLPFSIIGPFVSVVLDRWSRQRVLAITDAVRGLIALIIAVLVWSGNRSPAVTLTLMILLLIAMSLNRFLMAALTAGLPYTIDRGEFLTASSIMPMVGPAGVLIGGGITFGLRLGLTPRFMPAHHADALVFVCAVLLFIVSVILAMRFHKHELGPDPEAAHRVVSPREVLADLWHGARHLSQRQPAFLGVTLIGLQRLAFGLMSVGMILGYRNSFHNVSDANAAMADIGAWGAATGVGFVLSAVLAPAVGHAIGVRKAIFWLMIASGVAQIVPGSVFERLPLLAAGFLLGLFAQSTKVCIDTVVQAHVDDGFKGRVFTIYDMVFNAALVAAALLGVWILPAEGFDVIVFAGMGVFYLLVALFFWWRSMPEGDEGFNRGTYILAPAEGVDDHART